MRIWRTKAEKTTLVGSIPLHNTFHCSSPSSCRSEPSSDQSQASILPADRILIHQRVHNQRDFQPDSQSKNSQTQTPCTWPSGPWPLGSWAMGWPAGLEASHCRHFQRDLHLVQLYSHIFVMSSSDAALRMYVFRTSRQKSIFFQNFRWIQQPHRNGRPLYGFVTSNHDWWEYSWSCKPPKALAKSVWGEPLSLNYVYGIHLTFEQNMLCV